MDSTIKQSEAFKLLKDSGLITVSKETFRDMITRGVIPVASNIGGKKRFLYDEVVEALRLSGLGKPKQLPRVKKLPETEDEIADLEQRFKDNPTLTDANILKTIVTTDREKVKLAEEEGKVISREVVEDKAFTIARTIRDKILSIPERMANELASIDDPHVIKELLYKEFGMMLEGFSEDSFL